MEKHLVVMAGGIGSRFWPMSRPERPKQFIDVLGVGRTLLQLTVDRFGKDFAPENTWVVTSAAYADMVAEQLPDVPRENILCEPCMRNTAPCIAYVAWKIFAKHPNASLVVTPADHFVVDQEEFRRVVSEGLNFVCGTSNVLTLGMSPTRPDTGYGYIQSAHKASGNVLAVGAFKEKPVLEVAQKYLAEGGYFWNAGIFLWDVRTAVDAIRKFEPEVAELMDAMATSFYTSAEKDTVANLFPKCKNISIDYAVMERLAGHAETLGGRESGVYVLPANFGWSDLGTWGSLHTQLSKDDGGNAVSGSGEVVFVESHDCVVRAVGGKKMVLQGLEGYIVAEDNNTLLVCKKQDEQRIKQFSELLKK